MFDSGPRITSLTPGLKNWNDSRTWEKERERKVAEKLCGGSVDWNKNIFSVTTDEERLFPSRS